MSAAFLAECVESAKFCGFAKKLTANESKTLAKYCEKSYYIVNDSKKRSI